MVVEPSRSVYEVAPLTEFQETLMEPVPQEPAVAERPVGAPATQTLGAVADAVDEYEEEPAELFALTV